MLFLFQSITSLERLTFGAPCCLSLVTAVFYFVYRWMMKPHCCRGNFKQLLSKRWSREMTSLTRTLTVNQTMVSKRQIISTKKKDFLLVNSSSSCRDPHLHVCKSLWEMTSSSCKSEVNMKVSARVCLLTLVLS